MSQLIIYYIYSFSPFTYDIHTEAINLLLVLVSGQIYSTVTSVIITMAMDISQYVTINYILLHMSTRSCLITCIILTLFLV